MDSDFKVVSFPGEALYDVRHCAKCFHSFNLSIKWNGHHDNCLCILYVCALTHNLLGLIKASFPFCDIKCRAKPTGFSQKL